MRTSSPQQQIVNLERRIAELNVFLKTEKESFKVKKFHEDIASIRIRIKELKKQ